MLLCDVSTLRRCKPQRHRQRRGIVLKTFMDFRDCSFICAHTHANGASGGLKIPYNEYPKFLFKLDLHIADSSLHSLGPREAKVLTTLKHLIARCRTGPSDVYIGK